MHDGRMVVGIDINGRRIANDRVVLGGQFERRIDISIGSGKPDQGRIGVIRRERQEEVAEADSRQPGLARSGLTRRLLELLQ